MFSMNSLSSDYGDFDRLMETRSDHGGFGNVTWNVGPHARGQWGPDFHIVHVDRDKLLSGRVVHPGHTARVAQQASEVGQQMDRGDNIIVPRVLFSGGRPAFLPSHLAAIHASGQRGAARVPVAVHKKDLAALTQHVGDVGAYGDTSPSQDPDIKYRWNGKGWYSKPSFNEGRCPQGLRADSTRDQCISGDASSSRKIRPSWRSAGHIPAAGSGGESGGDEWPPKTHLDRMKQRIAQGSKSSSGSTTTPPIADKIDRSHPSGKELGKGLDYTNVIDNRMDDAIESDPEMQKRMEDAIDEVRRRDPSIQPGQFYGAGAAGAVYAGPAVGGMKTVYKFDHGPYEARLAEALKRTGLVGKLKTLPIYIRTMATNVRGPGNALKIHMIQREDLSDAVKKLPWQESEFLSEFGIGFLHSKLSYAADESYANERGIPHIKDIKTALEEYDKHLPSWRTKATNIGGTISKQFDRIASDTRKLIERGILPCDLHSGNWGIRHGTGEIVMRDVGCSHLLDK